MENDIIDRQQEEMFWDVIEMFEQEGILQYIMLVGSWSEYIYMKYYKPEFISNLKTRDVDFLYRNIGKPQRKGISIIKKMEDIGFDCVLNRSDDIIKFDKDGRLEVEFLTRALGKGDVPTKIPYLNIKGIGLRSMNILDDYPLTLTCGKYKITVPEPEIYVLQKLFINPDRSELKKGKDIRSIIELLPFVDKEKMRCFFNEMTKKQQKGIMKVVEENHIDLW